jgi:hypothetical protein
VVVVVVVRVDLVVVLAERVVVLVEGGGGRGLERWDLVMLGAFGFEMLGMGEDLGLGGPVGSESGRRGAVPVVGEGGAADPGDRRV